MKKLRILFFLLIPIFLWVGQGYAKITNGSLTLGVVNPENAFDGDPTTRSTIPWFWNEGGHNDFLHFVDT